MELKAISDDLKLNAESFSLELTAIPDDWKLNSTGDVPQANVSFSMSFENFLVDASGNFLVDPDGNFLVTTDLEDVYPRGLTALPDDFNLNAE